MNREIKQHTQGKPLRGSFQLHSLEVAGQVARQQSEIAYFFELHRGEYDHALLSVPEGANVKVMQVSSGAGSALHGTLSAGVSASLVAPSQALPEMFPSMIRLVRERLPTVFHIAAQSLSEELAFRADHRDVMAVRDTGFAILFSGGASEEARDIAQIAHSAATQLRLPVLHVFDGWDAAARRVSNVKPLRTLSNAVGRANDDQPNISVVATVERIEALMASKYHAYQPFEYVGAPDAEAVVVVLAGATATVLERALQFYQATKVGLLKVRLYRPWAARYFVNKLPATATRVGVVELLGGDSANLPLYRDVLASVRGSHTRVKVTSMPVDLVGEVSLSMAERIWKMASSIHATDFSQQQPIERGYVWPGTKQCVFWDSPATGGRKQRTEDIKRMLSQGDRIWVEEHSVFDAFDPNSSGSMSSHLRFGQHTSVSPFRGLPCSISSSSADFVACHDPNLLWKAGKGYNVIDTLRQGGLFLLNAPWSSLESLEANLSQEVKLQLAEKRASVYVLDTSGMPEDKAQLVLRTSFFVAGLSAPLGAPLFDYKDLMLLFALNPEVVEETIAALTRVEIPSSWATLRSDELDLAAEHLVLLERKQSGSVLSPKHLPSLLSPGSSPRMSSVSGVNGRDAESSEEEDVQERGEEKDEDFDDASDDDRIHNDEPAAVDDDRHKVNARWREACWALIFDTLLGTQQVPTAEVGEGQKSYQLRVRANKRLTPVDYDRNVFHLELDLGESGMRYKVGDALGISAHNDPKAVAEFLESYGVHPQQIIELPLPDRAQHKLAGNPNSVGAAELRTAEQAFLSSLDIFGRPARNFYEALAERATDEKEKEHLLWLISPAGGEEYKQRVAECVTFADLLKEFPSARPSLSELVRLIPRIKMRVYSIASSNAVYYLFVFSHIF